MFDAAATTEARGGSSDGRPIKWLFIGGGAQFELLRGRAQDRGLKNMIFKPYQPRERLAESLSAADLHLVTLRPELEGYIVPSKFYGIAAAGRAAIFIGSSDGEIARIVKLEDVGLTVPQGDGQALADAVIELSEASRLVAMGLRSRAAFDRLWERSLAARRWSLTLAEAKASDNASSSAHADNPAGGSVS
jgi:colanic acid biosynthesis glycosyl transferase WcaI